VDVVAAADMLPADEDLRHGVRPPARCIIACAQRGCRGDIDFDMNATPLACNSRLAAMQ
jgi:hypothetical protein